MSLDISIKNKEEEYVYDANITHNMAKMARMIPIDTFSLYTVIWRPEELNLINTTNIIEPLLQGLTYMISHRKELLNYNPENGWGNYDEFLNFVIAYKQASEDNPDCRIEISR